MKYKLLNRWKFTSILLLVPDFGYTVQFILIIFLWFDLKRFWNWLVERNISSPIPKKHSKKEFIFNKTNRKISNDYPRVSLLICQYNFHQIKINRTSETNSKNFSSTIIHWLLTIISPGGLHTNTFVDHSSNRKCKPHLSSRKETNGDSQSTFFFFGGSQTINKFFICFCTPKPEW